MGWRHHFVAMYELSVSGFLESESDEQSWEPDDLVILFKYRVQAVMPRLMVMP